MVSAFEDMVVGVRLPEPLVLGIVDARLFPGIPVKMADAPRIAHGVSRRGCLGMESVVDHGEAVVPRLVDLAAFVAVALGNRAGVYCR